MVWLFRKLLRAIIVLAILLVGIPALGLAYGWLTTDPVDPSIASFEGGRPSALPADRLRAEIADYQRPLESTFLTYPEWSIVYSAREYADVVATQRESAFPYWAHIGRYWRDYVTMIRATADLPFNAGNHLMLVVIGTSHTIEHAIQSFYENTVGRLTELTSPEGTPQDTFQAQTAAQYAAFLDHVPWYGFPYAEKRAGLWNSQTVSGARRIRSWERKLAFGLSYTIKQAYADLIKAGLDATHDPAMLDIVVWATGPVEAAIADEPDTTLLTGLGADGAAFRTQRYQVFTEMVPRLVERGLRFVEIGGNDVILLTVLSSGELTMAEGSRTLFAFPLPSDAGTRRTGLVVPVPALHAVLPALTAQGATLEHIYDY